ncbi:hypothetical protein GCM10009846_23720 [Agrococcus versicolor]|uniref:Gram-positive cocci surface proteins LPxTG domain-containing protein n=1 Tax=Agrococcus versicolor TaxID=501482 RepID=A0ABP5MLR2_9MICO
MRRRLLAPAALAAAIALLAVSAPTVANAATLTGSNTTPASVDSGQATRAISIAGAGTVDDVTIAIRFQKTDGTCAVPGPGSAFPEEIRLALTSPEGTTIDLVTPFVTYTGAQTRPPVTVTFDDDAADPVGGAGPVDGVFRPAQPLSTFDGEPAAGAWTVVVEDLFTSDPLCFISAELTVVTGAPVLADATLPAGVVGTAYAATITASEGDAPIVYSAVDPAAVPAGLTVNADGTITGTPSAAGDFAFDVVATSAGEASEAATLTVRIDAPAGLSGPATAAAQIAVPFSYVPTFEPGSPAAVVTATGLPQGLVVDPTTGAITGTPTGELGDVVVVLTADNGVDPAARLEVVVTVAAGPAASIALTPTTSTVSSGSSVAFEVTGIDAEGNAADTSGAVLTTDDASDVVDGRVVAFTAVGTRVVTATDPGGAIATATVEVAAAPVPSAPAPSAPAPSDPAPSAPAPSASAPAAPGSGLPQTGADLASAGLVALAAMLMLGAGSIVLVRRRTQQR